jgi:hypothetical protein
MCRRSGQCGDVVTVDQPQALQARMAVLSDDGVIVLEIPSGLAISSALSSRSFS